jgi:hypothetical protein
VARSPSHSKFAFDFNFRRYNSVDTLNDIERQLFLAVPVRRCKFNRPDTRVETAWRQRLKLNYAKLLSAVAFKVKVKLAPLHTGAAAAPAESSATGRVPAAARAPPLDAPAVVGPVGR